MMRLLKVLAIATMIALVMAARTVWADELDLIPIDPDDPETVHIGPGAGTTCATGDAAGCQIYQGHLNALNNNSLSIYLNGAGQPNQNNPILLILGIPNVTSASLPLITDIDFYDGYPHTGSPINGPIPTDWKIGDGALNTAGGPGGSSNTAESWYGQWNSATGYAGQLTGANQGKNTAYQIAHLSAGGSESWVNWSGADAAVNGIVVDPTIGFAIYVYKLYLYPPSWNGDDLINVTFGGGGISKGTFAITYSCSGTSPCSSKNTYSVPFTQAGLVTNTQQVPEPASIVLIALGLAVAGGAKRLKSKIASRVQS